MPRITAAPHWHVPDRVWSVPLARSRPACLHGGPGQGNVVDIEVWRLHVRADLRTAACVEVIRLRNVVEFRFAV
jgi:hypothetical protein